MKNLLKMLAGTALVSAGAAALSQSGAVAATAPGSETLGLTITPTISLTLPGTAMAFGKAGGGNIATGDLVTATGAMTVITNNKTGYSVSIAAATTTLAGTSGNTDTIPVNTVQWKNGTTTASWPGSPTTLSTSGQTFATTATKTALAGDTITQDFRIPSVPYVAADTYSTTLNVIATTNP